MPSRNQRGVEGAVTWKPVSAAKIEVAGGDARHLQTTMLYMVIERFKECAAAIYRRFREKGRMMPDGLKYVSSWIDHDFKVCYQLMETEDFALFDAGPKLERSDGIRNRAGPDFCGNSR